MSELHDWVIPSGNTTSWKCLKCDMRVLSHGRPNEEGCSERYYPNDTRRTNHRPESYSTKGPAVVPEPNCPSVRVDRGCDHKFVDSNKCLKCGWSPEKPKLSVEQVITELRREVAKEPSRDCGATTMARIRALIDQLPKPDVVEECASTSFLHNGFRYTWETADDSIKADWRRATRAALRRYLELRGLPVDPELEGK